MPIWMTIIFASIGIAAVMTTVICGLYHIVMDLIERAEEKKYRKDIKKAAKWLGEWGA